MLAGYSSHLVTAFPGQFGGVYARSLIEAALDPMVTISPDGRIDDVNEATIKVTGLNLRVRQRQVEWGVGDLHSSSCRSRAECGHLIWPVQLRAAQPGRCRERP